MDIPIVDFRDCGVQVQQINRVKLEEIGTLVYQALATVGFVYLKNTGVPRDDIQDAFRISKNFFNLPSDVKRKYKYDEHYSGYHDFFIEKTNPLRPTDFKESFHLGGMALASGADVWPDEEVNGFSSSLGKLFGHCRALALRFLEVLSAGMRVKDRSYLQSCHSRIGKEKNYTTLRSLHYPPLPDGQSMLPNQLRLGEHTDYGSFTLLFQGEVGGLEIERRDGVYIDAPPITGTVLVNIGDLLQFWSGGRLKSTRHRIRSTVDDAEMKLHRQSIVCFVHPNYEVELQKLDLDSPSQILISDDLPIEDGRKCVTAREYAEMRYAGAYKF